MLRVIVGIGLIIIAIGQIFYAFRNFQEGFHKKDINISQLMKLLAAITGLIGILLFVLGIIILIHH
ncbi:hypothetical protein DS830_04275 [Bombilactobacillus bombi]|uniref:Uncharacterized protein n=1 Tax=Bombilactobacillus bombi TaxID=1303590 RepID=A0A347SRS3_9LACO|nr:hypothetical protein [Bombilactobacillus bombi]AXX64732.1 hypothetical protein DS830_04275 [Bombilactobacillus bombi]RHW47296.1 hypothetical protein DS832_03865 [Bombilactobacillus bombi]